MKKIWLLTTLLVAGLLLTGCFNNRQDLPKNPIIFEKAGIDWNMAIENEWKYYLTYSTIKPKWVIWDFNYAFWNCLWYVWEDKNDRIYELSWESRDEWLIEYYVNGEMEIPTILKEISISGYIPESIEEPEEDIPEWWWERITVVTNMCEEEWWTIDERWDFSDRKGVCNYPDNSFCYLDSLLIGECHKWDIMYNDGEIYRNPPEDQLNWKPLEEAFCDYNKWVITENEYWDMFCTFPDWGYYELKAFKNIWEMPSLRWPDEPYCSDYEDIVCWIDWISYVNECWMKSTGMEKDPNAKFVDGKCVKK